MTMRDQSICGAPRLSGLTQTEAEISRHEHGANILTPPKRNPWWKQFLEKFNDPVIRILMIAATMAIGVGAIHGQYMEGVGIIAAILLATTLAFVNEYKASKEFDILNRVNDEIPIKVIRDANFTTVSRKDIVVGDIVLLEAGEEVPADGQALDAISLHVDESQLTGESAPVLITASANGNTPETVSCGRLLRGTTVVDGHGIMKVTAVGDCSEIGQTARTAAEETGEETPLNKQLERLSKAIGVIGFGVACLTFLALMVRGVLVGDLSMNFQQWCFFGLTAFSALVAGARIWMPIVNDGTGREMPAWLKNKGPVPWLKTIGLGAAVFCAGFTIFWLARLVPRVPGDWLQPDASIAILRYFMVAVTIIVVAVPEGLAMSITLNLAYSMRRMTASNNLVRHLHACETIGAATVICSDKTGTLTMNEMRVCEANFPGVDSRRFAADRLETANRLIVEAVAANSTANLSRMTSGDSHPLGNPTEGALLLWLDQQGIDYIPHRDDFQLICQWTFRTDRKYMATLGRSTVTGNRLLHVKGAPEMLLAHCTQMLAAQGPVPLDTVRIEEAINDCQARGMRTLAFAYCDRLSDHEGKDIEELTHDMTWLGFVAIADPVRPEVPGAISACHDAGIGVKIVTGDNAKTAHEIGQQIGLLDGDDSKAFLTGAEFSALSDNDASRIAEDVKVLSRARPADKMRLVKLLRKQGHVVAVTGDGTNDAPALNHADVGLSMGTGTSVAKEASDIVLLDDSFGSIVNAVVWGRSLYLNIQRFILFQLTINVVALGIALLGPFIGVELPLTVTQMLWVNLIMDTFAALALAFEPPDPSLMKRPPRNASDFIVTKAMALLIFPVAAAFLVFLVGFLLCIKTDSITAYELSAFFSTFVFLQFWNLFNARRLGSNDSSFVNLRKNNGFMIVATAIFIGQILIVQFGGQVFRTVPLSLRHWLAIIGGTSVVMWAGELVRFFGRIKARKCR